MSYEADDGLELEDIIQIKNTPFYAKLVFIKSYAIKYDFYVVERLLDGKICHLTREEIIKKEE
jgi:hypothetical protein